MRAARLIFLFIFLLWIGCAPQKTKQPQTTSVVQKTKTAARNCELGGCESLPIPEDLQTQVKLAEAFGLELYVLDHASAVATDVARAHDFFRQTKNLGGYLPLREVRDGQVTNSFLVSFYSKEPTPKLLSQVRVSPQKSPEWIPFSSPQPLPAGMLQLIKARQNAVNAVQKELIQPTNPVVLMTKEAIIVYLLSGTTTPNLAIFGRHFRVLVSNDGETVQDVLIMSKNVHGFTIDEVNKPVPVEPLAPGALELPYQADTAVLAVTQIVTDWPMESHVFINLLYGVPIYVITARGLWLVENGQIAFLTDEAPWMEETTPID